ncbi:MAG TPA: lytic transglycosylase domain-containing protein, partial [Bacteroidetes bacterium]|nr:lytic transglycosylase domain-containing protein [Bacteroidota bacterium]
PISNIRLGCRHLSALIQTYGVEGGIAAYNGGERKAAEWLASNKAKGILYKETENYVPAVLRYNNLYQKSQL